MSNTPPFPSGAWGLERYLSLKYYNVEKQKSRFLMVLYTAENKYRIKKKVQINVV